MINDDLLQIDVSQSKSEPKEEDLIEIKLGNDDLQQVNYSKLVSHSLLIREKYKYSEALKSLQSDIDYLLNHKQIRTESIKHFIELIQNEKTSIRPEICSDIYKLTKYFRIPKFTRELEQIRQKQLNKDLNFSIQILIDSEASNEDNNNDDETDLISDVENFLKSRINECIGNPLFKNLRVSTIYRILDGVERGKIDQNQLVDFVSESANNRFTLLRFVDLDKLNEDKVDQFLNFLNEQRDELRSVMLDYMPFSLSFILRMRYNYREVVKEVNELKSELNQMSVKYEKVKIKLEQAEVKKYAQSILVGGYGHYNHLGMKPNCKDKSGYLSAINPPQKSSIDPFSLLSCSFFVHHSMLVTKDGSLLGSGYNADGRVSSSLPKTEITQFTELCIKDSSGRQLDPISAACTNSGALYMFSKSSGDGRQLVFYDCQINGGEPVFLEIGNEEPVSLFSGYCHAAAISDKGEVIFINNDAVKKSPSLRIEAVSLPEGEKASSVACLYDSVIALSSNGRVFSSQITKGSSVISFSAVKELVGEEIVWVSGQDGHCLAVSKGGRVFGIGQNYDGQLGLGKETQSVSSFTLISSLLGCEIRAAYAGGSHSLFETQGGKILSCGYNHFGQLLLSSGPSENVYQPTETTITCGASFCIVESSISAVFIGGSPPPNTPNRPVQY